MDDNKPVIGILGGTGKEGPGLAMRWAKAGYPIIIGSRKEEKAKAKRRSSALFIQFTEAIDRVQEELAQGVGRVGFARPMIAGGGGVGAALERKFDELINKISEAIAAQKKLSPTVTAKETDTDKRWDEAIRKTIQARIKERDRVARGQRDKMLQVLKEIRDKPKPVFT